MAQNLLKAQSLMTRWNGFCIGCPCIIVWYLCGFLFQPHLIFHFWVGKAIELPNQVWARNCFHHVVQVRMKHPNKNEKKSVGVVLGRHKMKRGLSCPYFGPYDCNMSLLFLQPHESLWWVYYADCWGVFLSEIIIICY